MCLEIYVHNTTPEHDTRLLSILNPVTGYTVYSPWQEPYSSMCIYPHITEKIDINQHCPWHRGCCRLEHHTRCQLGNCNMWTKYHHFVDEENGESKDLSFLDAYTGHNPIHPFIAGWLFKSGAELEHSNFTLSAPPTIIEERSYAAGLARAEWWRTRIHDAGTSGKEHLAQFAILWDRNTGPGALPLRPGSQADPMLNDCVSSLLGLRVAKSEQFLDAGPILWPHYIQLWDKYRDGILPVRDDPFTIPWIAGGNTAVSDPGSMFSAVPDSVGDNVGLDTGDNVHIVEALVDHDPPHAAPRAARWYKVRWEGDWENDKETWERDTDISPQLIDTYWEKLNVENP
ncbi:hypothetical protein F4814DRAFT_413878 [Daldinia grandis]|nr:hypothetical protein F4814DRAFT_413878 [Daldinia grandis]